MIRGIAVVLAGGLGMFGTTYPSPGTPWVAPVDGYPLRVQIMTGERHYHTSNGYFEYVREEGVGNLLGDKEMGLAYNMKCEIGFHHSPASQPYQARWKKQDQKLEILIQAEGKKKPTACTIDVTMRAQPYRSSDVKDTGDSDAS